MTDRISYLPQTFSKVKETAASAGREALDSCLWNNSYSYFLGTQDSALNKLQDADISAFEKFRELNFTAQRNKY